MYLNLLFISITSRIIKMKVQETNEIANGELCKLSTDMLNHIAKARKINLLVIEIVSKRLKMRHSLLMA